MKSRKVTKLSMMSILFVLMTFSGYANAGCSQKKIAGTWSAQSFFVDSLSHEGYWVQCKIKLNSKGKYNPNNSICVYDTGEYVYPAGEFKVKSNCMISASYIYFFDVYDNYLGSSVMNSMTVDKGQSVMQGVGDSGTTMPFIFNAVKR